MSDEKFVVQGYPSLIDANTRDMPDGNTYEETNDRKSDESHVAVHEDSDEPKATTPVMSEYVRSVEKPRFKGG